MFGPDVDALDWLLDQEASLTLDGASLCEHDFSNERLFGAASVDSAMVTPGRLVDNC